MCPRNGAGFRALKSARALRMLETGRTLLGCSTGARKCSMSMQMSMQTHLPLISE